MSSSGPTPLCFPPVGGQTVRADFEGSALSSSPAQDSRCRPWLPS